LTLYLDTSSLVKLYVKEEGSEAALALVERADAVVTSVVAYPEVRATLARLRRDKALRPAELARSGRQFDDDWSTFVQIDADERLARDAGRLADAHALRGCDAIHLASFEALLARCDDGDVQFLCADDRLNRAARSLG
jgi:predicted nucleic acid-binding protein